MASDAAAPDVRVVGGWASPFVMRVCVALRLKGVAYEFLQEELVKKIDLLLASNPVHKKMPVLLHGGRPVCESLVILQYVDKAFAGAGPPTPTMVRPRRPPYRFWAEYTDAKVRQIAGHDRRRQGRGGGAGRRGAAAEQVAAALGQLQEAFAGCSEGRHFFAGDDVGFLDIVLGSYVGWFRAAEKITGQPVLDETRTPRLAAWVARFCAHEAVGDVMPDAGRLVEFGEALRAALAASASRP
ncbi:probable glutathione S-transferase GSTU6 [Setaria viridis]|uniref:probable glutathione S-transferase GSTU6 n=1 Tax=Setaria viridis TaxID=4556 RepID=UPI0014937E99|nr:probable glutathione S-transferase GSTU6 [Setaria viridis]